ncbi:hypothetical protein ACVME8_008815 [Bradyrhizobium diazoefficiens]
MEKLKCFAVLAAAVVIASGAWLVGFADNF